MTYEPATEYGERPRRPLEVGMYERPGRSNQDRTCIYTHAWWQKQPSNHFQVDFGAAVIDGHSKYLPQDPTQNEYLRQQGALAADWISKNFGRIFLETSW